MFVIRLGRYAKGYFTYLVMNFATLVTVVTPDISWIFATVVTLVTPDISWISGFSIHQMVFVSVQTESVQNNLTARLDRSLF